MSQHVKTITCHDVVYNIFFLIDSHILKLNTYVIVI